MRGHSSPEATLSLQGFRRGFPQRGAQAYPLHMKGFRAAASVGKGFANVFNLHSPLRRIRS